MKTKLYQKCCRLCLDDTKEQMEVSSVDHLAETLQQLYNVKVEKTDHCTKKICIECFKEANETQKWLKFYEEQKKLIAENQQIFNEELIHQLGPERTVTPAVSAKSTRSTRSARKSSRRIDFDGEEEERGEKDEDFVPKKSPRIKKESVTTRRSVKKEWMPHSDGSGQESTTPTEHATDDDEEEEEEASETATSTTDDDLKCPKCEKVFREIEQLERHSCEFICNICSATLKYRHSLKRHLIAVHKIKASQWEDYWNPVGDDPHELLVETSKPKKRYRYESDSPTDMEEDSNSDDDANQKDLICSRCGDKFYSTQDMKSHDCDFGCNICGATFASRNGVKRHKIRLHNIDPNDPSVASRPRVSSSSRPASRPPSRPPSRAISEHPSDDEPLAALASKNVEEGNPGTASDEFRYRYYCADCDYSNFKRYSVTQHLMSFHHTPKDQIDVEAIPRKLVPRLPVPIRSKTPTRYEPTAVRSKTPIRNEQTPVRSKTPIRNEPTAARPKTPIHNEPTTVRSKTPIRNEPNAVYSKTPIRYEPIASRLKTPEPMKTYRPPSPQSTFFIQQPQQVAHPFASQHRSRSRSIHQDSRNGSKRKRSRSSCSNKSARTARARSNPPPDRQILVAKRRLSPSRALANVPEKLRPTVTGIESNRLFVTIRQSCETFPPSQQLRIRAISHLPQEPCPKKRLFKLRPPVGSERQQVQNLRGIFRKLSPQISSHSKVNTIDVDSLVLDLIHPPKPEAHDALVGAAGDSQQLLEAAEIATFEIREVGSDEAPQVVVAAQHVEAQEVESPNARQEPEVEVDGAGKTENGEAQSPLEEDEEGNLCIVELPEENEPEGHEGDQELHDEDVSIIQN